eukprot:219538-Chlamydomonas_euryale.AAC.2
MRARVCAQARCTALMRAAAVRLPRAGRTTRGRARQLAHSASTPAKPGLKRRRRQDADCARGRDTQAAARR